MKKIIKNKVYDTETATEIGSWSNGLGVRDFNHCEETLYRKKTGEYFLYGSGGAMTKYAESTGDNSWTGGEKIIALGYESAREWAEEHLDTDAYQQYFEVDEDGESVTKLVTLDAQAVSTLDRLRAETGDTYGTIIGKAVALLGGYSG